MSEQERQLLSMKVDLYLLAKEIDKVAGMVDALNEKLLQLDLALTEAGEGLRPSVNPTTEETP